jgi:hypothetical protein
LFATLAFIGYFEKKISFPIKFALIFLGFIILSLLFRIIVYKFNSHNKIAGYIRLLTQEIDYIDFNEKNPNKVCSSVNLEGTILSWEFIMGKWDKLIPRNKFPIKTFKNIKFHFQPSNNIILKNSVNSDKSIDELRYDYFEKIKHDSIMEEEKMNFLENIIFNNNRILTLTDSYLKTFELLYNYLVNKVFYQESNWKYRFFHLNKVYKKYKTSSWQYPFVIFKIFTIIYIIFLIILVKLSTDNAYVFDKVVERYGDSSFNLLLCNNQNIIWFSIFTIIIINYLYFLKETVRVLILDKSVDFYCWAFLPFRVQLLNEYDFTPIYSSNFFRRYKNSLSYLHLIKAERLNENSEISLTDEEFQILEKTIVEGKIITNKKLKSQIDKIKNNYREQRV